MILSPDFCEHYKTKILIRLAGHEGVFCLLKLWSQCQFRKNEVFEKSPDIISAIAGWSGDPTQLEKALIDSGFAKRSGEKFILHQWQDSNKKLLTSPANGKKGGRPKINKTEEVKGRYLKL